ncbi:MAG: hypothetical protein ACOC9T_03030 [Myxococcota bacterium]
MTSVRGPHYLDVGYRVRCLPIVDGRGEPVDISTATVTEIIAKTPSGAELVWEDAELDSDGTDGVVAYETVSEDLSEVGGWTIQAHVKLDDGAEFHGPQGDMWVHGVLNGDVGIPEGVSSHAHRHHHDGPDPLSIEDLEARDDYTEPRFFGTNLGTTDPGRIESFTLSLLAQAVGVELNRDLVPRGMRVEERTSSYTLDSFLHWRHRYHTDSTGTMTVTIPSGLDRTIHDVTQVGVGGKVAFAADGVTILEGADIVLHAGETARVYAEDDVAIIVRLGPPRMREGTITGDETHSPSHHNQQRIHDEATDAEVTFEEGTRGTVTVYDRLGDGALSFVAGSGVTLLVPDGLTASAAENGRVVASYVRDDVVRLMGELEESS